MSYREALMILGVSEPYDMIELKKAYREKAKAFHPDINSSDVNNNTKMMQLVNEAYSVIKNSNQSHKRRIMTKCLKKRINGPNLVNKKKK